MMLSGGLEDTSAATIEHLWPIVANAIVAGDPVIVNLLDRAGRLVASHDGRDIENPQDAQLSWVYRHHGDPIEVASIDLLLPDLRRRFRSDRFPWFGLGDGDTLDVTFHADGQGNTRFTEEAWN